MVYETEFYAYLHIIFFYSLCINVGSGFFLDEPDPGKKCWIIILDFTTRLPGSHLRVTAPRSFLTTVQSKTCPTWRLFVQYLVVNGVVVVHRVSIMQLLIGKGIEINFNLFNRLCSTLCRFWFTAKFQILCLFLDAGNSSFTQIVTKSRLTSAPPCWRGNPWWCCIQYP